MAMTKAEAEGIARLFLTDYPGALELAYKFREDVAELYGPRAAEAPPDMKGGYLPKETMHAGRTYRGQCGQYTPRFALPRRAALLCRALRFAPRHFL